MCVHLENTIIPPNTGLRKDMPHSVLSVRYYWQENGVSFLADF